MTLACLVIQVSISLFFSCKIAVRPGSDGYLLAFKAARQPEGHPPGVVLSPCNLGNPKGQSQSFLIQYKLTGFNGAGGHEGVALPGAMGNSQTQQAPTVQPPEADPLSHGASHSMTDADPRMQPPQSQQQQQQQSGHNPAQACVSCQPSLQANPTAAPMAAKHTLAAAHPSSAAAPQQAEQTALPAKDDLETLAGAAAASRQAVCRQRSTRWPGNCSQAISGDANDLHGVAAVVVRARRAKSCSATGRQHTAKKLVFQQRRLAQQPSLQTGAPTSAFNPQLTNSPDSAAKAGSAYKPTLPLPAVMCAVHDHQQEPVHNRHQESSLVGVHALASSQARSTIAQASVKAAQASLPAAMPGALHTVTDATAAPALCQRHEAPSAPDQRRTADQTDLQRQCTHREAEQANAGSQGSQEQWETAINKLRRLAEKHSQDSQDDPPAESAAGVDPRAAGTGEQRAVSAAAREDSVRPDHNLNPSAGGPGLQRQTAALKLPVAQTSAVSATGHPGQVPPGKPSVTARVSRSIPVPKVYTGLSQSRALMRQQRQQVQAPESVQHTAQMPNADASAVSGQVQKAEQQLQQPGSNTLLCQQPEAQQGHQAVACTQGQQGHKRKWPEADPAAEGSPRAANPASAQMPCKKQRLPVSSSKGPHSIAADDHRGAAPDMTLHSQQLAGASHAPSSLLPGQSALADGTGTDTSHENMPSQVVAWPVHCKPKQMSAQKPRLDLPPTALPKAAAVMAKAATAADSAFVGASAKQAAAAAVGSEAAALSAQAAMVTVTGGEVAAEAGRAEAAAVAVAEQQDRSQGGSEAPLAGFRLDLSSEEDPLLCTQRLPSSQGLHPICPRS